MTRCLIDTNIVSEFLSVKPDANCEAWLEKNTDYFISVMTIDEIIYGLTRKHMPTKSKAFEVFLVEHTTLLPVTEAIARTAAKLRGEFSTKGIARHQADMLIATTA